MENTLENKAKFFAQYWGQYIAVQNEGGGSGFRYDINEDTICDIKYDYLKLKPLSSITLEDLQSIEFKLKVDINEIEIEFMPDNYSTHWIAVHKNKTAEGIMALKDFDYLRSKGYALPYMSLSVEKLIEYGWVKLKTS